MLEEWIVRLDESYTALKAQASRMDEELQELRKICRVEVRPLQPESEPLFDLQLEEMDSEPRNHTYGHEQEQSSSPIPSMGRFWSDVMDDYVRR